MNVYRRDFVKGKCMSLFINDEKLLEKYYESWKKCWQHYQKRIWL